MLAHPGKSELKSAGETTLHARSTEQTHSLLLDAISTRAALHPDLIALAEVDPRGRERASITTSAFVQLVKARALSLAGACGRGDTILVALPSTIDLAAWFVAAIAAGLRLVLMHPTCGPGELRSITVRTGARVVITPGRANVAGSGRQVRLDDKPGPPTASDRLLLVPGRSPGSIVLGSSGTTGLPKLALREIAALDADAVAVSIGMGLSPADIVLCVPPLSHSYGVDVLLGALYSGASLRIMTEFDAAGTAAQLGSGVTVLPGLPFIYESLLRVTPPERLRLRLALSAGSSISARIRSEFAAQWGVEVGQLYGATELGTVAVHHPGGGSFDPASIGTPLDGVSFRILDIEDDCRELPRGEVGQLAVRAASMLSCYLDGDVPLSDGHFLTGDLARLDTDGRAQITGRMKHLIDVGGFKVNPLEVESALLEHPGVADCALAPLELSDTIRRVRALVVPSSAADPPRVQDLRAFLKERLSAHKVPRVFEMVDSVPRSALGKLLRDRLPGGAC